MSLKNIKLKIQSVQKTRQVTKAMEAVSAVKMRKTQAHAIAVRPYATAALEILKRLSGSAHLKRHPLTRTNGRQAKSFHGVGEKTCAVVVTSDRGLAGSLNSAVLRKAEAGLARRSLDAKNTIIVCVGKRGAEYFSARGYDVRERFENVDDITNGEFTGKVLHGIMQLHESGEISRCIVAYTNLISTFEQVPVIRQIIPLTPDVIEEIVANITPKTGMHANERPTHAHPSAYTVEPNEEEVLAEVLPLLMNAALFHALAEAKASEHSARMVAMKSATDKAGDVARDLSIAYNKARQTAITAEVSEITSGIEAMR